MQVLIVDDDATSLYIAASVIRRIDNAVPVTLSDPLAALDWLEDGTPDLILIDHMMPGMDGMTLLERIRGKRRLSGVPVVMITAETSVELRVAALERGCTDFLTKPYIIPELLARAQTLLGLRSNHCLLTEHAANLRSRVDEVTALLRQQSEETEAVLKDSEQRFQTLADSIPQLAWMARPDGDIFWFNRRWYDYTGTTPDSARGSGWRARVHPDDAERVVARYRHSLAAGEPWEDTFPLLGRQGEWRRFLSRALPVRNADGDIVLWFGTNTDITEQMEAQEALRRAKEAAEQVAQSKSKFLASASHDLRQPMQSLFLFAGALHNHVQGDQGRAALSHLERGLDVLKSLLDSLLDVSRLDAGVVRPTIEDFPLDSLLDHVAACYAPVARGKGLEWRVAPCRLPVRSDRVLLGRIIRNLVENAVRYTSSGAITVACHPVGDHRLRIEVRDTGIGIPDHQLPRIFEEFHQVGNPERDRSQGLGLGLAIVQRISRLLDHPVAVRSRTGEGSVFSVEVPLGERRALAGRGGETAPEAADGERFAVVVDDDAIVLLGLQAMLKEWGYAVLIAGSGAQAVERLKAGSRTPDVIIADYRLREGEVGTDAILAIQALFDTRIPSIIVTGETGPECQRDAAQHGFGLMHKPVTPRQLGSALKAHIKASWQGAEPSGAAAGATAGAAAEAAAPVPALS